MRLSRFQLFERWWLRETAGRRHMGNFENSNPDVKDVARYAFLMGYEARERQQRKRKARCAISASEGIGGAA